ncbi:MAG: hypothetical protein KGZ83_11985 [Sulfuricella sp.]|nr:hypothetical protein [Sulfuricella sp.]
MRYLWAMVVTVLLAGNPAQAAPPAGGTLPMQPILRIETGQHLALITRISADAAGRFAVTASEDKTVRVWDGHSGRLLQVLRPPIGDDRLGAVYAAALSPDGESVAVGGYSSFSGSGHALYLFDRASGTLRKNGTLSGLEAPIHQLAWSKDGQFLAVGLRQQGLRVFRGNLQFVGSDPEYNEVIYGADFSRDGRLAVASLDGSLRLYRIGNTGLERLARLRAPAGKPYSVAFSPDGTLLAVGYQDAPRVDVLDAATLSLQYSAEYHRDGNLGNLGRVAWSRDGRTLFGGGTQVANGHFPVVAWSEAGQGAGQEVLSFANIVTSLAPLGDGIAAASADPAWAGLDGRGKPVFQVRGSRGDFRGMWTDFRVSADGRAVAFKYESDSAAVVFDTARGELLSDGAGGMVLAEPRTGAPGLTIEGWKNTTALKLNGRPLPLRSQEPARSLAISPDAGRFVVGSEWSLRQFDATGRQIWEQPLPAAAWAVNVSGDGRWVLAALGDGTIRWHRGADGQEQLALFPHPDRSRWILWTPAGNYDTSVGGEALVGWHLNQALNKQADFFSIGRFRKQYYRPEVVQQTLSGGDYREALRLADTQAAAPAVQQMLPPVVILQSDSEISTSATQTPVKFAVRSPLDAPAQEVKIRVDGKLVRSIAQRSLPKAERSGESATQEIVVALPPKREVEIVVLAKNRNGVSEPATLRVTRAGKDSGAEAPLKFKKLYLLAVGVSQYPNLPAGAQLTYPAKDAVDFSEMFRKYSSNLYEQAEIRVLTNEQATRKSVLGGLAWLRDSVGTDDVGILFLAGHGFLLKNNRYFFASRDIEFVKDDERVMQTAVSGDAIQDVISNLKGRGVFFLDTCHAGFALSSLKINNDVNGMLNEAEDEKGVVVLSGAGGKQSALESDAWKNGAFTYAIKEGIIQRRADLEKDGRITPPLLHAFVSKKVKEMTKGEEHPPTPKMVGAIFNEPFIVIK